MPVKVVVLGAAGMLGHKMFQRLRAEFPTVATMRKQAAGEPFSRVELLQGSDVWSGIDAMDFEALAGALSAIRPRFLVNCIGIIKQRPQAGDAIPSIAMNAL